MKILRIVALACFLPISLLATVTSQVDKTGPFLITALPQTIPTGFPFVSGSELKVLNTGPTASPYDPAIVLTLGSDYTVTGGNYNTANQMQSGSIVVVGTGSHAVAANDYLVIMRNVPINQTSSFTSTGPLTVTLIEQALDKMATLSQQVNEIGSRSLQFENFEFGNPTLFKNLRSGKLLGFNSVGIPTYYDPSSIPAGTVVTNSLVLVDGTTTSRTLGALFNDRLSILDWGADPTGVADCTAALNAACTYLNTYSPTNGGVIYFPRGVYKFTTKPNAIVGGVTLQGEGKSKSYLHRSYSEVGATTGFIDMTANASLNNGGGGVRGFGLYADTATTGGAAIAIVANVTTGQGNITLDDLYISGAGTWNYPVYIDGTAKTGAPVGVRGVTINNCLMFQADIEDIYAVGVEHLFISDTGLFSTGAATYAGLTVDGTSAVHSTDIAANLGFCSNLTLGAGAGGYVDGVNVTVAASISTLTANANLTGAIVIAPTISVTNNAGSNALTIISTSGGGNYFGGTSNFYSTVAQSAVGAANAYVTRYNASNSQAGIYANSGGSAYFGSNVNYSSGDKYSISSLPAAEWGNVDGNATNAFELNVAASGTAGNAISWTRALNSDGSGNLTALVSLSTPKLTISTGSSKRGTFTVTAGAATVVNATVTANSAIVITLKTVGGTIGGQPYVDTITPTTGFTVAGGGGSNTSTYNYVIIE